MLYLPGEIGWMQFFYDGSRRKIEDEYQERLKGIIEWDAQAKKGINEISDGIARSQLGFRTEAETRRDMATAAYDQQLAIHRLGVDMYRSLKPILIPLEAYCQSSDDHQSPSDPTLEWLHHKSKS